MPEDEDRAKLRHLLGHWVEHNRSHEASYTEWAGRAYDMGEGSVGEYIGMAVEKMREADGYLQHALEAIDR